MNFLEKMALEGFAKRALEERHEVTVPAAELEKYSIELATLKEFIERYAALPPAKRKFAFEVVGAEVRVRRGATL